MSEKTIALIGNPNCGKSTLFNALTGAHQHVGNYPGITVEKHEGTVVVNGKRCSLVDLPGTYSLTAYSDDELVARNFLVDQNPDAVLVLIDATNLERSLYLVLQIQELGKPVIVVLNMMDEVRSKGITIDLKKLSEQLHAPVLGIVARTGEGKQDVLDALAEMTASAPSVEPLFVSYGSDLDPSLEKMESVIGENRFLTDRYPARWTAIKYMENDSEILERGRENVQVHECLQKIVADTAAHTTATLEAEPVALVADHRYGYISSILRGIVKRPETRRFDITDKLDKVLCNALLGPIIMLSVLYGLFWLTIELGATPQGWVEGFFDWLGEIAEENLPEGDLLSLIKDGIIAGVGGVISFAPLILIMFFFLSFLEDSGYLARMAYMLDRIFRIFGLHGSSVVPFIISGGIPGGCAVPGVMAARTLRSPRERIATVLTAPFLSCGAKTPVFLMIAIAFFSKSAGNVLFLVTLAGWAAVLLLSALLRKTVIAGPSTPFVMELPPYRIPTLQGLLTHTWERVWMYVKKAGTVILAISILIWAAMNYPGLPEETVAKQEAAVEAVDAKISALDKEFADKTFADEAARSKALEEAKAALNEEKEGLENAHSEEALRHSIAGRIGVSMEPLMQPCGFDWRTNIALLGGFAAKEVIISTLGTAYSMGEVDPGDYEEVEDGTEASGLAKQLASDPKWNKRVAVAFMLFVLFYSPCFVTIAVIGREIGWKWAFFSMAFNTVFAYLVAVGAYNLVPLFMK